MMPHSNKIHDTETHFIINPSNRTITNDSVDNNIIVQYDHNSERFTFEMPRYVDGHDMSECKENGEVRVNFRNSASTGLSKNDGVYICDDLAVSSADKNKVTFSWLLSSTATQYIGYLYFSIQFICFNGDNIEYSWNTGIYKDITIVESINNIEQAVESDAFKELTDLVRDTKVTLEAAEVVTENANKATIGANSAAEEANNAAEEAKKHIHYVRSTEDGKLQILDANMNVITTVDTFCGDDDTLYRYEDGMLSVVGIKELNLDKTFRMWVGTNEELLAIPEAEIDECTFYWVTDDATYDEIVNKINEIVDEIDRFEDELTSEVRNKISTLESDLKSGNVVPAKSETAYTADTSLNGVHFIDRDANFFTLGVNALIEGINGSPDTYGDKYFCAYNLLDKLLDAFKVAKGKPIYIRSTLTLTPHSSYFGDDWETTAYYRLINVDYTPVYTADKLEKARFDFKWAGQDITIWCHKKYRSMATIDYDCQCNYFTSFDEGDTFEYTFKISSGTVDGAFG